MRDIPDLITGHAGVLARHSLCGWLHGPAALAARRAAVLPAIAPVALGAAGICTNVLRYPAPRDDIERHLGRAITPAAAPMPGRHGHRAWARPPAPAWPPAEEAGLWPQTRRSPGR